MEKPSAALRESRYSYAAIEASRLYSALPSHIVFDVGAGAAPMREPLGQLGYRWHGFDLYQKSPIIKPWDLDNPCPLPDKANFIILMDVIEHLLNPGLALTNIVNALAPNGALLITTPNPHWRRSRVTLMRTGYLNCFTESDLALNHHVFTPWPHIVFHMLKNIGLKIEKFVTLDGRTEFPRPYLSLRYPIRLTNAIINKSIERLDPVACGMSYAITAFK